MEIPMDRQIAESYSKGIPIVLENPSYIQKFEYLFERIKNHIVGSNESPMAVRPTLPTVSSMTQFYNTLLPPFSNVALRESVEKLYEPDRRSRRIGLTRSVTSSTTKR